MAVAVGSYTLHKTSLDDEANVLVTLDWSQRHEIVAGATVASAAWRVLLANAPSSDLTLSAAAVASPKTQVRVTDVSAQVNSTYHLVCDATLSDGTLLVESVLLPVQQA